MATLDSILQNGGKPATEPIVGERGASILGPRNVSLNVDDATVAALSKSKPIIVR